jgi:tetratricopeptide (TPR) repeat protein
MPLADVDQPIPDLPIPDLVAALDLSAAELGPFHPQTIVVVNRLAMAFWKAGDINQAVGLLDQALDGMASSYASDHPVRSDLLCTLGEIMAAQGSWEPAALIYREILEDCVRRSGSNDASSLAAEGDLAVVLFELGKATEAGEIERDAADRARTYLGKTHPVSCVLAWNRAQRLEGDGDADSARAIIANDLLWLLSEDENELQTDQKAVRAMLAKRWGWDTARVC